MNSHLIKCVWISHDTERRGWGNGLNRRGIYLQGNFQVMGNQRSIILHALIFPLCRLPWGNQASQSKIEMATRVSVWIMLKVRQVGLSVYILRMTPMQLARVIFTNNFYLITLCLRIQKGFGRVACKSAQAEAPRTPEHAILPNPFWDMR